MFFILVIANADLFDTGQEQLVVNSGFIQDDDGVSYEINLDNVNVGVDANNDGGIQYTVQKGDTLLKIASVFWTTVSIIKKDNNLSTNTVEGGQTLKLSNQVDGILYTIREKTNVVVFANKYNLNIQDLMTLNYVQDETEIFSPEQEIFININKDRAYELGLLQKPKPEVIPKSTIAYRPAINKSGKPSVKISSKPAAIVASVVSEDEWNASPQDDKNGIISKWTYTKKIKNSFYAGQCTWYAAIISPNIFPYINETTQERPFGGDAREWCANAKKAGFKVGNKPGVGALIVYGRLRSSAGHVGKVINYYPDNGKMIIRDMNYIGKFVVTERWEDTDNSKISCYIYWK